MRQGFLFLTLIWLVFASCYNSYKSLEKYAYRWHGKIVKVRGKIVAWYPAEDFGYYFVVLQSLHSSRKIVVYTQLNSLKPGQVISVKGRFYRDSTLMFLGANLIIDSSEFVQIMRNPQSLRLREYYGDYPRSFEYRLKPRFKLPHDCRDTVFLTDTLAQDSK